MEVWSVDSAGCPAGWLEVLDRSERERHAVSLRRGRPGYGAGRAALRHLIGAGLDIDPHRVAFARSCATCGREGHGRPVVAGVEPGRLEFSVATSCSMTLIAIVRHGRVGVDVEQLPPAAGPLWPRPCFSAREREQLEKLDEQKRPEATARSWVRKEAVSKCLGLGLAMAFANLEVTGGPMRWQLPDRRVQVCDLEVARPFVAAVARDGHVAAPRVREWRWN